MNAGSSMLKKTIFSLLLLCSFTWLSSQECRFFDEPQCFCDLFCGPHRFGIGPEFYYIERKREGERPEDGWMIGERFYYERLRPWCIYYGADQYYATGHVTRKRACGGQSKSKLQDAEVEGRLGYTLLNTWPVSVMFTPFIGFGNFTGTSKILKPRFLKLTFRPSYNYVTAGFLSNYFFCNGFASIGLNMKWKFMSHARNKIIDNAIECHPIVFYQDMGERTHIQVDVPFTYYYWCCREQFFEISIVPFYRNRIYGSQENCPFDFLETKYEMWGCRYMITFVF